MTHDHDSEHKDTRGRIIEAATNLFGLKGFDGTSTREICKLANVNIASLNYHFQSKDNLRNEVNKQILCEFKEQITTKAFTEAQTAADFAERIFLLLISDGPKCLSQFKIFIESDSDVELEPYPLGFEQFSHFFSKELKPEVPIADRIWASSMVFSSIVHMSVVSSAPFGKRVIEKYYPDKNVTVVKYIRDLVDALIRDLNSRF